MPFAGAGGAVAGSKPPGGGSYGGYEEGTSDWYNPFSWGKKKKGWRPDPSAFAYTPGMPDWAHQGANMMAQMQAGGDVRAQQMDMMALLQQRAQGQGLASEAMAAQQLAQGQGAVASQAASQQRGGYDPATARAAMYAQGSMAGDVAGQASIAAAQETMAAAQAAGTMGQGMREADINQMIRSQMLANQLRQMGMSEKAIELQSRMAYEQAAREGFLGETEGGGMGRLLGYGLGALGGSQFGATKEGAQMGGEAGAWLGDL